MSSQIPEIKYQWHPIEPLSVIDKSIDLIAVSNLIDVWHEVKARWQQKNIIEFRTRLIRRFSIETGILERLYNVSEGITKTLVEYGFAVESLRRVSNGSENSISASSLIDMLKDHQGAIEHIMDGISGQRQLTKSFVHELHQGLVEHQNTVDAEDQYGNRIKVPLLKGTYKELPNSPTREDGLLHQYCPPVHVESEMDALLKWLGDYSQENPILVAAWLHHRFTQIHPYQDGNGRLARTLMTYVLLKANLLPVVIQGDDVNKNIYINALEAADYGDLEPLVQLISRLEQEAILQALSFETDEKPVTTAVFEALRDKLEKRNKVTEDKLRNVNAVALAARAFTKTYLEKQLKHLNEILPAADRSNPEFIEGGNDKNNGHWYRFQLIQAAKQSATFVNFSENRYFLKTKIQIHQEQLVFVVSWHHVGRELSGVMQATAFAELESVQQDISTQNERSFSCSTEPYTLTHSTDPNTINGQFTAWLDAAFAVAFKAFSERL
jgi:Fic family protein